MNNEILDLRDEIDQIDNEIVELFLRRITICKQIGVIKEHNNIQVANFKREQDIITRLSRIAMKNRVEPEYIETLYEAIFDVCREVQINIDME